MEMPVNPHTGLINVTPGEVQDARMAEDGFTLVREDGTLTRAGQVYVADMRTIGHEDCERCFDPAPEGWEDYELVNEAQWEANDNIGGETAYGSAYGTRAAVTS